MPDSLTMKEERTLTFPRPLFEQAADTRVLSDALTALDLQYDCVRVTGIGQTLLGRTVYAVTLGNPAAPGVLYVGGIHAADILSPAALLRFIADYGEYCEKGKRMYGISMTYLCAARSVTVIPMLNPDGIAVRRKNAEPVSMGRTPGLPPELWTGNGRGADLAADFEGIGKEAESAAVTGFLKTVGNTEICLGFDPAENALSYDPAAPRSVPVGRLLSRMIGCSVKKSASGMAKYFTAEYGKPAYTCPTFAEENTRPDDYIALYAAMREALFSLPLML